MRQYWLYLFGVTAVLFSSCQQTIDVDLGAYEPKVVVHGILVANENPKIYLTESRAYLDQINDPTEPYDFIKDALVTLTNLDDNTTASLALGSAYESSVFSIFDPTDLDSVLVYYYEGNLPIAPGNTYELNIAWGSKVIKASTTVPEVIAPVTLRVDSFEEAFFGFSEVSYGVVATFNDPPSEENAYRIKLATWEWVEVWNGDDTGKDPFDSVYIHSERIDNIFETDDLRQGEEISIFRRFQPYGYNFETFADTFQLEVTLQSTSRQVGQFFQSLDAQRGSEENPFSEPRTIPSNIEGGLGIFGSMSNSVTDTIEMIYLYGK